MSYTLIKEIKIPAWIAYESWGEKIMRCDNFTELNSTHDQDNNPCKSDSKTFTNIMDASDFLKKFDLVLPKNVEIKTQGDMNTHFGGDHKVKPEPVRGGAKNNYVQWNQDSWLQTRYVRDNLLKNHNNGLIQFIPNELKINNGLNKPKHNLFNGGCYSDNKIINKINTNVKLYDRVGYLKADGNRKYVRYEELIPTHLFYNRTFTCDPSTSYLENVLSTKEYTGDEFSSEVGRGLQLDGAIKSIDYNYGNDKVTIDYYKLKDNYSKNIVSRPAIEIEKKDKYKIFAKNYSGNESSYEKGISELSDRGMIIDSLTASLSYLDDNEISCTEGYGLAGFKIEGPNNNKYKITPYCLLIDEVVEEDGSKRNPTDPPKDSEDTPWYLSTVAIIAYVVIGLIVIIVIIAIIFAASSGSGSSSPTVIPEGYEVVPY